MTVLVFVGSLLGAMALGMPIAFALIACATVLMAYLAAVGNLPSFDPQIIAQKTIEGADTFTLLAIPFFLLAGEFMNAGGLSRRIVDFAVAWVGHIRGGLGIVAVVSAVILSALSGSAAADTAALSAILIPMMRNAGYDVPRSAGLIAASGIIGPVIPPSIAFIIFGIAANVSITRLLLGGIVPGLMLAAALIIAWMIVVRRDNIQGLPRQPWSVRFALTGRAFWALFMPVIVLGGIRFGIFTPTEAAVVAAVYAFLVGMFVYRELKPSMLYGVLLGAAKTTAVVMFLVASAIASAWLITGANIPGEIGAMIQPLVDRPKLLLVAIMILVLVVGTALDLAPTILILTPVLMPIVKQAGIDPVYFGVLFVMNNAIGLITPPVGIVLNVVSGVARVPLGKVIVAVWPFLIAETIVLFLLVLFPELVTVPLRFLTGR